MRETEELRAELNELRRRFDDFRAQVIAAAVILFLGAIGSKLFG